MACKAIIALAPVSIRDVRSRHVNGLRKAIDINCQMVLNPRDFLTSVVTFVFSSSGVFDALSVNDNKGS